jgi:hypothetical protein
MTYKTKWFLILFFVLSTMPLWAQVEQAPIAGNNEELSLPQIEIAGEGLVSLDYQGIQGTPGGSWTGSFGPNFSDSSFMVGAAKQLYDQAVGSFSVGMVTRDTTGPGGVGNLFLSQLMVDYQTKEMEWVVGRTNAIGSRLFSFPTIREDDLWFFNRLLNPLAAPENLEAHRYSDLVSGTFNWNLNTFVNIHAQRLIDDTNPDNFQTNSYGLNLDSLSLPGYEAVELIPQLSLGYEYRSLTASQGGSSHAVYGGLVFNLNQSVVDRIDLRLEDFYTFGNSLSSFVIGSDAFRLDSNAITASIRWHHDPFGLPGYQLALTGGYRTYTKVLDASAWGVSASAVKDLGEDVDVTLQYTYQQWTGSLLSLPEFHAAEQTVQLGFAFRFDTTFNRSIGPRRSLLNILHQYIPN